VKARLIVFATRRKKFANWGGAFNRTNHLALADTLLSLARQGAAD